jgi:hypothetical protein
MLLVDLVVILVLGYYQAMVEHFILDLEGSFDF